VHAAAAPDCGAEPGPRATFGAALFGFACFNNSILPGLAKINIADVAQLGIGIGLSDGTVSQILRKNTTRWHLSTAMSYNGKGDRPEFIVNVFEGDSKLQALIHKVGEFKIKAEKDEDSLPIIFLRVKLTKDITTVLSTNQRDEAARELQINVDQNSLTAEESRMVADGIKRFLVPPRRRTWRSGSSSSAASERSAPNKKRIEEAGGHENYERGEEMLHDHPELSDAECQEKFNEMVANLKSIGATWVDPPP
jgi:molecular chaperone DnaK (HSP70)